MPHAASEKAEPLQLELLHTATVLGAPVRFVRSPAVAQPDLPWHVPQDLYAALKLPRGLRTHLLKRLATSDWAAQTRQGRLAGRMVTIAPHFMAQGLIGGMVECRQTLPAAADAYSWAMSEAFKAEAAAAGLSGATFTSHLLHAVTGRPQKPLTAMVNTVTGEPVVRLDELQTALGMSDSDVDAAVRSMNGLFADPNMVARVQ